MLLYYCLMTKWSGLGDKYGIISGKVVTPRPVGSATVCARAETGRCPSVRALRSGSCARRGWALVGATRHARTRWSAAPPRTIGRPRRRTSLPVLAIPRLADDWTTAVTASPCCSSLKTPPLSSCASNTLSPPPWLPREHHQLAGSIRRPHATSLQFLPPAAPQHLNRRSPPLLIVPEPQRRGHLPCV
jgi:hypothetical protein